MCARVCEAPSCAAQDDARHEGSARLRAHPYRAMPRRSRAASGHAPGPLSRECFCAKPLPRSERIDILLKLILGIVCLSLAVPVGGLALACLLLILPFYCVASVSRCCPSFKRKVGKAVEGVLYYMFCCCCCRGLFGDDD